MGSEASYSIYSTYAIYILIQLGALTPARARKSHSPTFSTAIYSLRGGRPGDQLSIPHLCNQTFDILILTLQFRLASRLIRAPSREFEQSSHSSCVPARS
ncbi:hypothetical protein VKT23_016472 [Stygiomarasmius scandens]|uniref:Uncharacterized protein n=1 Tax=Marasmiellus scandens TaxID=2682957 RepID=A0ABR1IWL9_9AGAR